ncbi:MAG: zinc ribbon domain-containing protein [Pseudomonadales bacterium]|nr:zinc ribbon domain-containing protein [Pseudomonadales bacterium]
MPIYEYQCEACSHKLEKLQKISDDPLTVCPGCGAPKLTKLISAAGFRLKGGGWYETDFKTGKKKNVSGDSGSGSGSGSSSSSSSSESSSSSAASS